MLPKEFRIRSKNVFSYVYRNGKRIRSEYGILIVAIDSSKRESDIKSDSKRNSWRFGFVISKKIGDAVKRNRMRRILSAIAYDEALPFLREYQEKQAPKGKLLVVYNALKFCSDYEVLKNQYLWQLRKSLDMVKFSVSPDNRWHSKIGEIDSKKGPVKFNNVGGWKK